MTAAAVSPWSARRPTWKPKAPPSHHARHHGDGGSIRPVGVSGDRRVCGLSQSQVARRGEAIARAAGLADWEFFSGRVGMARRMAQNGAPTHETERQGRWKQDGGIVGRYTRGESAGSALTYL